MTDGRAEPDSANDANEFTRQAHPRGMEANNVVS
jgi:hypothetical protein